MRKKIIFLIIAIVFLISCSARKVEYEAPYINYDPMEVYEVIDSTVVDSLISKASREHKRITGKSAMCFIFSFSKISREYNVTSSSFYYTWHTTPYFGFAYYKGFILIISVMGNPEKLFRPTGDTCYVTSIYGGKDISHCEFDSTFQFVKSENGIVVLDDSHLKKSHRLLRFFKKKKK